MRLAEVVFFFDPGCPWAWLATVRLREAAMRCNARIAWRPILALKVDAALGTSRPSPAESAYLPRDLVDWAHFCGVVVRRSERLPAAVAARAVAAGVAIGGAVAPFVEAIFSAGSGGHAEINSRALLLELAAATGLDAEARALALDDPRSQAAIEDNTAALIASGGFGSATMVIGDRLFCGNARIPLVELALTRAGDRPLIIPGSHGQT